MFQGLTGWHALIILIVIVLLFGAAKLPALAKSVGQSMKIFKNEVKSDDKTANAEPEPMRSSPDSSVPPAASERNPKP